MVREKKHMPVEQVIDELKTIEAWFITQNGGSPICISEAIRLLSDKKYLETQHPVIERYRKILEECTEEVEKEEKQ